MEKNLEIVDLWPTKVAMTDLVDHNHLNLELIELGLVWDLEKQDLTTNTVTMIRLALIAHQQIGCGHK